MTSPLDRDIAWLTARLDEVADPAARRELDRVRAIAATMLQSSEVDAALAGLSLEQIHGVLKLLTTRFHLRNKAEQVHIMRINRQREARAAPDKPRPESLDEVVGALAREGMSRSQLLKAIAAIDIQPTLTAHPTESRRRSVVEKQRRIGDLLQAFDSPDLPASQNRRIESAVRQTLSILMATDEVRARRLDVIDEVRNGLHFLAGAIWNAVPALHRDLRDAIDRHFPRAAGESSADLELPTLLRYRTWIGGDRDGNPNVTAQLTRQAFAEMRAAALERHAEALDQLSRELSISDRRVPVDSALTDSIARDAKQHALGQDLVRHLQHEPFRVKIRHMQARLRQPDYSAADFIDDLALLQRTVRSAGLAEVATCGVLADALVRARAFGFHLAALDVRQHSNVHAAAVAEMFAHAGVTADYAALSESQRREMLGRELQSTRPLLAPGSELTPATRELLDSLKVVAAASSADPASVGSYIVSMAHEVSDVLEVLILFREVGLWSIDHGAAQCPIDVVPLFETVEDLTRAAEVLRDLFAEPAYVAQLAARGRFQEIMLGYSDSNKDGGYWAANWGLYSAQKSVSDVCTRAGVAFRFFHGRGGTVARGGGRAHRAILASPASSNNGRIRFTEQGEVISFRYAAPAIAHRHLEQIVNAMIQTTARSSAHSDSTDAIADLMTALAASSKAAYRALVDDEGFWPWFVNASPVLHIGELPIASRPVSRAGGDVVFNNLRAIPWVFAWTQMRYNAPGWYGIGTAFAKLVMRDDNRLKQCCSAYHAGGSMRAFIDNAQQEMARARLPVGRWYAGDNGHGFHQRLADEFARTEQTILAITGQKMLLDNNPVIQLSISQRNPDTDAINALQIELLRRWRDAPAADQAAVRALVLLSVNALAAAMQSTG